MPRYDRRSGDSLAHRRRFAARLSTVALLGLALSGCAGDDGEVAAAGPRSVVERQAGVEPQGAAESAGAAATAPNPLRNVYFGDLPHAHQLLLRRVPQRHAGHTGRRLPLRAGRAADPRGRIRDSARQAAGLPRGHRPRQLPGHAAGDAGPRTGGLAPTPRRRAGAAHRSRRADGRGAGRGVRRHPGPHPGHARGPARPERGALGLARDHRRGRAPQRSGPLHHVHRLRVHRQPREPEPAPQRDLPRQRGRPRCRSAASTRSTRRRCGRGMDRNREAGMEGPGHPPQLERLQRPDVPARHLRRRAARRRLRRDAYAQRAAGGDHPDEGHLRHPSGPLPQRRVGGLRDSGPTASAAARPRASPREATCARPT